MRFAPLVPAVLVLCSAPFSVSCVRLPFGG